MQVFFRLGTLGYDHPEFLVALLYFLPFLIIPCVGPGVAVPLSGDDDGSLFPV